MKKQKSIVIGIITTIVLILIDQLTKHLAVTHLKDQEPFVIIKDVFQLYYLENQGAAFGIMQGKQVLFYIITIIIVCILAYFFVVIPEVKKYRALRFIILLIEAGAIGNFIDRVVQHYVVDFFYFELINFPVFNVADIYVTCAAIAFVILILFRYKEEELNEIFQAIKKPKKKAE